MSKKLIIVIKMLIPLLLMATAPSNADGTDDTKPEIVGSWQDGEIVATFDGFVRLDNGLLGEIPVTFMNMSESTTYELLLDDRLNQIVIQFRDGDVILNDPFEGAQERMLGDIPLNLVTLAPSQMHTISPEISNFVDDDIYSHLDSVSILFNIAVPIYSQGANTTIDSNIGRMRVYMFPKSVPVIDKEE